MNLTWGDTTESELWLEYYREHIVDVAAFAFTTIDVSTSKVSLVTCICKAAAYSQCCLPPADLILLIHHHPLTTGGYSYSHGSTYTYTSTRRDESKCNVGEPKYGRKHRKASCTCTFMRPCQKPF